MTNTTETKPCGECGMETAYMICANECGTFECEKCAEHVEEHLCHECHDNKDDEDDVRLCDIEGCEKEGTHALHDGEYHYCDEHYDGHIVGECCKCGTEIHDTWDWTAMACGDFCRPCGKDHHYDTCAECFPVSEEEEEACLCAACDEPDGTHWTSARGGMWYCDACWVDVPDEEKEDESEDEEEE